MSNHFYAASLLLTLAASANISLLLFATALAFTGIALEKK